jgi:hypothetical protein
LLKSILLQIIFVAYIKSCEIASCICVKDASLVRAFCPNDKYNECIANVPCVKKGNGCDFVHNQKYKECQIILHNKPKCIKTDCSGQICSDKNQITTCEYKPEYDCYKTAKCERQDNGKCEWTMTKKLKNCLNNSNNPPCKKTGCGDMCADHDIMTLWCPPSEKYKCYETAEWTRQSSGDCGFTSTPKLEKCLANTSN